MCISLKKGGTKGIGELEVHKGGHQIMEQNFRLKGGKEN